MANTKNAEGAIPFTGNPPPHHEMTAHHHQMNPDVNAQSDMAFGATGCSKPDCKAAMTGQHAAPASRYVLGMKRAD